MDFSALVYHECLAMDVCTMFRDVIQGRRDWGVLGVQNFVKDNKVPLFDFQKCPTSLLIKSQESVPSLKGFHRSWGFLCSSLRGVLVKILTVSDASPTFLDLNFLLILFFGGYYIFHYFQGHSKFLLLLGPFRSSASYQGGHWKCVLWVILFWVWILKNFR